jgi:hypothetical protein
MSNRTVLDYLMSIYEDKNRKEMIAQRNTVIGTQAWIDELASVQPMGDALLNDLELDTTNEAASGWVVIAPNQGAITTLPENPRVGDVVTVNGGEGVTVRNTRDEITLPEYSGLGIPLHQYIPVSQDPEVEPKDPDPIEDDEDDMYLQRIGYTEEKPKKTKFPAWAPLFPPPIHEVDMTYVGDEIIWGQRPLPPRPQEVDTGIPYDNAEAYRPLVTRNPYSEVPLPENRGMIDRGPGPVVRSVHSHKLPYDIPQVRRQAVENPDGTFSVVEVPENPNNQINNNPHQQLERLMYDIGRFIYEDIRNRGESRRTIYNNLYLWLAHLQSCGSIDTYNMYERWENNSTVIMIEKNNYRLSKEFMLY